MIDSFGKIKNATKLVAFFICIAILLLAQRSNAYIRFTFAFFAEGNRAVNQCEERVILADTYVLARIVDSTSLANDDVASFSELTTEKFDAESLAFRLAAVLLNYLHLFCVPCFSKFKVMRQFLPRESGSGTDGVRSASDSLFCVSS